MKDILETWRLRLPNEWDPLLHWQDVLVWRNTVYNVVISVSVRPVRVCEWEHAGVAPRGASLRPCARRRRAITKDAPC